MTPVERELCAHLSPSLFRSLVRYPFQLFATIILSIAHLAGNVHRTETPGEYDYHRSPCLPAFPSSQLLFLRKIRLDLTSALSIARRVASREGLREAEWEENRQPELFVRRGISMYFAEWRRRRHTQFPKRRPDGHAMSGFWSQPPWRKMGVANHEVSVDLIQLPDRFKPLARISIGG